MGEQRDLKWSGALRVVVDGCGVSQSNCIRDERPEAAVPLTNLVFGHRVATGRHPGSHAGDREVLRDHHDMEGREVPGPSRILDQVKL